MATAMMERPAVMADQLPLEALDDSELVAAHLEGRHGAFDELYE